jgi:hypothetical protein
VGEHLLKEQILQVFGVLGFFINVRWRLQLLRTQDSHAVCENLVFLVYAILQHEVADCFERINH